jgi:hypothetical protein
MWLYSLYGGEIVATNSQLGATNVAIATSAAFKRRGFSGYIAVSVIAIAMAVAPACTAGESEPRLLAPSPGVVNIAVRFSSGPGAVSVQWITGGSCDRNFRQSTQGRRLPI